VLSSTSYVEKLNCALPNPNTLVPNRKWDINSSFRTATNKQKLDLQSGMRPGHVPFLHKQTSDSAFTQSGLWYSHPMASNPKLSRKLTPTWKALIEVGFIIFLFYSNLLMGEFTRTNGHGKSLASALEDIFSATNLGISIVSGAVGYLALDYLRKRL